MATGAADDREDASSEFLSDFLLRGTDEEGVRWGMLEKNLEKMWFCCCISQLTIHVKNVIQKGSKLKGKRLWIIQGADVGTPQETRTDKSTRAVPGASHLIGGISLITGLTWSSESVSLVKSILITMVTCGL